MTQWGSRVPVLGGQALLFRFELSVQFDSDNVICAALRATGREEEKSVITESARKRENLETSCERKSFYSTGQTMEVVISRRELFVVLMENNALAITFKSSVGIALNYVKEKMGGSELTQNAEKNVRLVLSRAISLLKMQAFTLLSKNVHLYRYHPRYAK